MTKEERENRSGLRMIRKKLKRHDNTDLHKGILREELDILKKQQKEFVKKEAV